MATILLQAAGAYLGGLLGPIGSAIGTAAGALAGYAVDRALLNGSNRIEGARLAGARPFTAEEGVPLPRLYGTARLGGILIWATRFEESRSTRRQGKAGPKVSEYSYYANAAFALCEGEIAGVRRIWADGREIDRESVELRVYQGSRDQLPDPLIEAKQGAGNTPAYRDVAYVVVERLPLGEYGNRIPQLQFEVLRPVGNVSKAVKAVALLPGSTEYGLSPTLVTRQIRPGENRPVNRNVLFAGTDIAASLDELQATCPNLENVALIVAWFGDDLRAGHCKIRPAVTTNNGGGLSSAWRVTGLERGNAPVVSSYDGGPAYGGTPSDRSVMEAIAEIKARGFGVTLYPLIMMDIAEGNTLPDPEGGSFQPPYPWRGRITCDPAPLQPGTADRSGLARLQVEAFCGAAHPGEFSARSDTIVFSGVANDWGYRRFILHYAHLAVAAGGVDAFLLGSELRGLTTLRDEAGSFPFVEALCSLAADVRSVVGPATKLTYGADWSEYFGHHPQDGSGDVYFHLDALWMHPAITAVGIDNYMPLSDWRDGDYAGGNPDGFAGPYDMAGMAAAVAGGEGFDWYYENDQARAARDRSPITDGAYGKPWVFRYKDIRSWWDNRHFNRVAGVEETTPTPWEPQCKPIWFTELGCPAADKGPNRPNVFPDAKSVEGGQPYFSNGGRSDIAQRRFLETHLHHWDAGSDHFDESRNPQSAVYDGRMVDSSRVYLWAWDARPFPAFPLRSDLWADGPNWSRGHWLNGRLANPDLASLVNAILADHAHPPAMVAGLEGTVEGYVLDQPTSARAALEPLATLFDLVVYEDAGRLVFRHASAIASDAQEIHEVAFSEDGRLTETERVPDDELPAEALLSFHSPLLDYQVASARSVRAGAPGSRQNALAFSGSLDSGQALALLEDWLERTWSQRETVTFLVEPRIDIVPGSAITLQASGNPSEFLVVGIEKGLLHKVTARELLRKAPTPWKVSFPSSRALPAPSPAGPPHVLFLDLPAAAGTGEAIDQFRIAVWQKPWRRQLVSVSPAEAGFAARGTVDVPATLGRLVEPLPPGFSGRLDRVTTATIELFDADLASVTTLQLLNGANAAAVRSASGSWEVLQFQVAEETSAGIWRLSGLLRGQLGTVDAMAAGSLAGADFVILNEAVVPAGLQANEAGLRLNWRVGPSSAVPSDSAFATTTQIGGLRALMPYAPVHLRGAWSDGDFLLAWVRCSRIDADRWDAGEIPLGEEAERYQVTIAPVAGEPVRIEVTSQPFWAYPGALMEADFGAVPPEIDFTVRQFSAAVGWGLPASRRLRLS